MNDVEHPYTWVERELSGTPFASISYVEETGSTNADASELLGDPASAGHTIVAEYQLHGAGRKGRSWVAQAGTALLCTTILPRTIATECVWAVPFWAGLALRSALLGCGIAATLRWPNDLLLADRKLAGVLCVSRITGATARVACGIGVNVHRPPIENPEIDPPPAYCDDVSSVNRGELLRAVLNQYDQKLRQLASPKRVAHAWEGAAGLPGRHYRILKDGATEAFNAIAVKLTTDGALIVKHDDGTFETVAMADARILR